MRPFAPSFLRSRAEDELSSHESESAIESLSSVSGVAGERRRPGEVTRADKNGAGADVTTRGVLVGEGGIGERATALFHRGK